MRERYLIVSGDSIKNAWLGKIGAGSLIDFASHVIVSVFTEK